MLCIAGLFVFSGCSQSQQAPAQEIILMARGRLDVLSPPAALEAVVSAVNFHYGMRLPESAASWAEKNLTPAEVTTSAVYEYRFENWKVSMVYRKTKATETIYQVVLDSGQGFSWEGWVTAFGEVVETGLIPADGT